MTVSSTVQQGGRAVQDVAAPPWGLVGARLRRPSPMLGAVDREQLVQELRDSGRPIISVTAPAGYGKTTLIAQWLGVDPRPSAWLSLGEDCNDPTVFMRYVAATLAPVLDIPERVFVELGSRHPRVGSGVVGGIGGAMWAPPEPFVLVIDDLEQIDDPHSLEALSVLTQHLSEGSQVALIGRDVTGFPLAAARARGDTYELGVADLRFDGEDAALLLRATAAGDLGEDEVAALTERTEGWAVGLFLAASARSSTASPGSKAGGFRGDDVFVADYLREEVLDGLPAHDVDFLIRTSVLEEMWGALCDATLDMKGSGAVLERLQGSSLLVVPLDHRRDRYRYHHLFRDLLRMELEHRMPELVPGLLGRASVWCEERELSELAITYAMAGHQTDRVADLLTRFGHSAYHGGRAGSLRRWMEWLDRNGAMEDHPAVAVVGSLTMALTGRPTDALRWAGAADGLDASPDDAMFAARSALNAMLCRSGVEQMRADAERALSSLPPSSEWRPGAMLSHAVALLLLDHADPAIEELVAVAELAVELGTAPAACTAFTELAVVDLQRGNVGSAAAWISRALQLIEERSLHGYASTALTHAVAARVALLQGHRQRARGHMDDATSLREILTVAMPTFALQARLELTRTAIGLGDSPAADRFLTEGEDLLRQRPDLGTLALEFNGVREELARVRLAGAGVPSLTPAEARLLPLLTTYLSFREIGERLFVSPHTVKTQAISIYRKLGVSSRGAAIEAARTVGLLAS
jgi:LuxR family maltose regulon positive regulatory protein